jgi:hypothetical protein
VRERVWSGLEFFASSARNRCCLDLLLLQYQDSGDYLIMALDLECYFDTGNQADSQEYESVTLSVISGTPKQWRKLEEEKKNGIRSVLTIALDSYTLLNIRIILKSWRILRKPRTSILFEEDQTKPISDTDFTHSA